MRPPRTPGERKSTGDDLGLRSLAVLVLHCKYFFPLAECDRRTVTVLVLYRTYTESEQRGAPSFGGEPFTEAVIRRPDDAGDSSGTAWRGPGVERRGEIFRG